MKGYPKTMTTPTKNTSGSTSQGAMKGAMDRVGKVMMAKKAKGKGKKAS